MSEEGLFIEVKTDKKKPQSAVRVFWLMNNHDHETPCALNIMPYGDRSRQYLGQ